MPETRASRMRRRLATAGLSLCTLIASTGGSAAQTVTKLIQITGTTGIQATGIGVDASGNVFVASGLDNRVYKIAPDLTVQTVLQSSDGFSAGSGLAVDSQGNVFVASLLGYYVKKRTPTGTITNAILSNGDGAGNNLFFPWDVAVGGADDVFVVGTGGFGTTNVFRITTGGVITEIIDASGDGLGNPLADPWWLASDATGNAYVTGRGSDNAFKITPAGVRTEVIDASGDGAHPLDEANGVAVGPGGVVYVSGRLSDNVFRIDPGGNITQILDASGDGTGNTLDGPGDLAVDTAGNLFVAGTLSDNVFHVTPAGVIREVLDSSAGGAGSFDNPNFITAGAPGVFYVTGADSQNAFKVNLGLGPPVPLLSPTGAAALTASLLLSAWRARPARLHRRRPPGSRGPRVRTL